MLFWWRNAVSVLTNLARYWRISVEISEPAMPGHLHTTVLKSCGSLASSSPWPHAGHWDLPPPGPLFHPISKQQVSNIARVTTEPGGSVPNHSQPRG